MAGHPTQSGQEPAPDVDPKHYPSSTSSTLQPNQELDSSTSICSSSSSPTSSPSTAPRTSLSLQDSNRSHSNGGSKSTSTHSSPSLLSEEQLAQLPPVFRKKSHQQCVEMEADRGRQALMALQDGLVNDIKLLFSLLIALVGMVLSGLFVGLPYIVPGLLVFVLYRHYVLVSARKQRKSGPSSADKEAPGLELKFVIFIMGSGGHTTEMLSMMQRSMTPEPGTFRRYIINEGDLMTHQRVIAFEDSLARAFDKIKADPGLFDVREVKRARHVHQSWLTTPLTAAQSLLSILKILFASDLDDGAASSRPEWRYPGVVVSNGPGTGFVFLAAVHVAKIFYALPADRPRTLFVESFTKVRSLSLTGWLLHHTGAADEFLVQHRAVAERYGKVLAENFVARPPVAPLPFEED